MLVVKPRQNLRSSHVRNLRSRPKFAWAQPCRCLTVPYSCGPAGWLSVLEQTEATPFLCDFAKSFFPSPPTSAVGWKSLNTIFLVGIVCCRNPSCPAYDRVGKFYCKGPTLSSLDLWLADHSGKSRRKEVDSPACGSGPHNLIVCWEPQT